MTTHELLTREALAERFGRDVRTMTNWQQIGMPSRSRDEELLFSWPDCRDWREEQIRKDARATRHAAGDEDIAKKLADARLRVALAEAEEAELNVSARRGELMPVDWMKAEFTRIAQALRTALLVIPQSWESRLAPCITPIDRQIALRDGVNDLMPVLQELTEEPLAPVELPVAPVHAASA